jgi:threonine/homoserine/homoserine lactone efflux protein
MKLDARLPAGFGIFADQPVWLFLVILLIGMSAMWILNNLHFAWLHRGFPRLFRPRVLLAILAICIGVIAVGLAINPPSEIQKRMKAQKTQLSN